GAPVLPVVTGTKPTRERIAQMSDELMFCMADLMPPHMHGYYQGKVRTTHWLQPYVGAPAADPVPARVPEVIPS
ncbi:MAG: hypothetical protein M1482_04550, partial [Chloroflexi bacterium]|nr:hypothetical protein [Chloroflexota bacterium]